MTTPTSVFTGLAKDTSIKDGSLRGVGGPLVKFPLISGGYTSNIFGTATVGNLVYTGFNPDGSAHGLGINTPTGVGNLAIVRTQLYGRTIGVRWRRNNGATNLPFDVVIDGVAYPVQDTVAKRDNQTVNLTDYEAIAIVATGLREGVHTVEVHCPPDELGTTANSLNLYGFLVERGRGYNDIAPIPRSGYVQTAVQTIPTTANTITTVSPVNQLSFHNSDSVSHTVTVYSSDGTSVYRTLTVAAGLEAVLTFPSPRYLDGWKWKVDSGTLVNGYVENA